MKPSVNDSTPSFEDEIKEDVRRLNEIYDKILGVENETFL